MVTVRVNGEERGFDHEPTIRDVLRSLGVGSQTVAVEVNRAVVPRSAHDNHVLHESDEVEIVTFVGGG